MSDDVIVLDGGMGQELLARSGFEPTSLWSADVMDRDPETVVEAHRAYLDAGAQVITLNAYSATQCRLGSRGRGGDYERLQRLAVDLAHRARREAGRDDTARIAGCLSPYEWTYRPELAPPFDELVPHYAETVAIQAPHVDVFLCETMGSGDEAAAAAVAAAASGLPVWVSWTLHDDASGRLRNGETIEEAVAAVVDRGVRPEALLVNCSLPESIEAVLPSLVAVGRRSEARVGAYANGFGAVDAEYHTHSTVAELGRRTDLDPPGHLRWVRGWIEAGLTIVGGCCEIGPAHIRAVADHVGAVGDDRSG